MPISVTVIHFTPLGSELLMDLRTGPDHSPLYVICNEFYTVHSSTAPVSVCTLHGKAEKGWGEMELSLESLLLQIVGDTCMTMGFSALREMMVVSVGLHNVYKACWGFPNNEKQKVPKETRIHQTKSLDVSERMTGCIHLFAYSAKIFWAPLLCQELC